MMKRCESSALNGNDGRIDVVIVLVFMPFQLLTVDVASPSHS